MTAPKLTEAQRRMLEQAARADGARVRGAGRFKTASRLQAMGLVHFRDMAFDHRALITDAGRAALRGEP